MFKFLTALFLIIFSSGSTTPNQKLQNEISKTIKTQYPDISISVPTGFPTHYNSSQNSHNDINQEPGEATPVPSKMEAYNTKSEKIVKSVSSKAVQNSPVLIPCYESPSGCENASPTPSPTPIPSLAPTSVPTATPTPRPEPISPFPTPPCKLQARACPMIVCIESEAANVEDICGCPCVPPPIYLNTK